MHKNIGLMKWGRANEERLSRRMNLSSLLTTTPENLSSKPLLKHGENTACGACMCRIKQASKSTRDDSVSDAPASLAWFLSSLLINCSSARTTTASFYLINVYHNLTDYQLVAWKPPIFSSFYFIVPVREMGLRSQFVRRSTYAWHWLFSCL